MAAEITPGQHTACERCPARTGYKPNTGCDTSKLDGRHKNQPFFCPLPRIDFSMRQVQVDAHELAVDLVNRLRRSGKLQ